MRKATHLRSPSPWTGALRRHWASLLVLLAILAYGAVFTRLAWDQHLGMRTHKADLGQIDQAVWNSSRGRFLESVQKDYIYTRLTDHVEPILVLISPIYWLWDDVRALLLLQVLAVALGAWPLYGLARTHLPRGAALAVVLAYLLNPSLQSAVLTEFHAIPLAVPLILWAFWALERGRLGQYLVAGLLLAGVKEEAALLAAGLGAWGILRTAWAGRRPVREQRRSGPPWAFRPLAPYALLLLSLLWFYLATFVIVPAYAARVYQVTESTYFQRYGPLGNSAADIFRSLLTRPGLVLQILAEPARTAYLTRLLAGFGFLGLLAPEVLVLPLPVLLANALSTYPAMYYGEFHYTAPLIPYMAVAGALGLGRLWRLVERLPLGVPRGGVPESLRRGLWSLAVLWLLGWSVTLYVEAGRGPGGGRYDPTPIAEHHRLLRRFVAQIPPDAAVTATAAVHPHVNHRRYVYQFPWGLDAAVPAEWALLDVTTNTDMAPGDLKDTVEAMLAGDWGVVDAADGFLLLRRGAPNKAIPDAFYTFVRVDPATIPDTSPLVDFGPLSLLEVSLEDWPRWRQTKVTTLWRVQEGYVPGTLRPWLELRTPGGQVAYTLADAAPPGLVWYPPERWQPGEVIRITTLWLHLPRRWGVAVAAVHGPDPGQPAHRLPVVAAAGPVDESGTLALTAAYTRSAQDRLARLALPTDPDEAWLATTAQAVAPGAQTIRGTFRLPSGETVRLQAGMRSQVHAGQPVDLWLVWEGDGRSWEGYRPFVHLRDGAGNNVSQQDGPPRLFVPMPAGGRTADWRELPVPPDGEPGIYRVVVGLFDPASGARAPLVDPAGNPLGDELEVGTVTVAPPLVPDQACALIPATCASQTR